LTLDDIERHIQGLSKVLVSQMGKSTDFKFGQYIHRVHLNKSPLKILQQRERGRRGVWLLEWGIQKLKSRSTGPKMENCVEIWSYY